MQISIHFKAYKTLKAFDCLSHELITAKVKAYQQKLIYDYLSNRQQRTKINHDFSSWEEVLFGALQGSVPGSILFNIFLSDLFFVMKETGFTSYADDNILYDAGNTIGDLISSLQESSKKLFKWFSDNQMQRNSGKYHLILSTYEPAKVQIGESLIESTNREKLLGVKIDSEFSFDKHIKMYKMKSGYTPKIFSDLFNQREISPYDLRRYPEFRVPLTRTVYHGSESVSYMGPNICDILPHHLRKQFC